MRDRLEAILEQLPEAYAEPYASSIRHRVRSRTFLYSRPDSMRLIFKLELEEADAVAATDDDVVPWDNELGQDHGWLVADLPAELDDDRWEEVAEWIITSYSLVAPKSLLK